jgi:hypothetical protein
MLVVVFLSPPEASGPLKKEAVRKVLVVYQLY